MKKFVDFTGQRFGRLLVIKRIENGKGGQPRWLCICNCGGKTTSFSSSLIKKNGGTKSCGCLQKTIATTHNLSRSRFYSIWRSMNKRCKDKNHKSFCLYGGKNIKIEWDNFEQFRDDMYDSYLVHCEKFGEKDTTIDRIKNTGNYCKNNCRWATQKEQCRNKTTNIFLTYNGETKPFAYWLEKFGKTYSGLHYRIDTMKWSAKKALETN